MLQHTETRFLPLASSPDPHFSQHQDLRGLSTGWQHSLQLRSTQGMRVTPGNLPAAWPCSSAPQRSRNPQRHWSQTRCAPHRLQSPERHKTTCSSEHLQMITQSLNCFVPGSSYVMRCERRNGSGCWQGIKIHQETRANICTEEIRLPPETNSPLVQIP